MDTEEHKGLHAGRLMNTAVLLLIPQFESNDCLKSLLFMRFMGFHVIAFSPQANNNYSQRSNTKALSHTTAWGKKKTSRLKHYGFFLPVVWAKAVTERSKALECSEINWVDLTVMSL